MNRSNILLAIISSMALAVAMFFTMTSPSHASTVPNTHARNSVCTFNDWTNKTTAASAWWTSNDPKYCDEILEAHIKCNARTAFHNYNGGWEQGIGIRSRARCPTNWHLYCAGIVWKYLPTGQRGVVWFWPHSTCHVPERPVHTTAALRSCSWRYDWSFLQQLHNDEQGGYADWEINTCNYTMQTRVECTNPAGADYYHYSGEVHGLEVQDWASCNLFDSAIRFWIDKRDTNSWKCLAGCSAPAMPSDGHQLSRPPRIELSLAA